MRVVERNQPWIVEFKEGRHGISIRRADLHIGLEPTLYHLPQPRRTRSTAPAGDHAPAKSSVIDAAAGAATPSTCTRSMSPKA